MTYSGPKRDWKQCSFKILEGQTKSIMMFLKVAYRIYSYNSTDFVAHVQVVCIGHGVDRIGLIFVRHQFRSKVSNSF